MNMTPELLKSLQTHTQAEVLNDAFSIGRYATDASIYQQMPQGVVIPRTWQDVVTTNQLAKEHHIPITARGAGTSQSGQAVNHGIILDFKKYLNGIVSLDLAARTVEVEPGLVLDDLNAFLKPYGLWFPIDISTSSRATIGGMAANNAAGSRSLRYGMMREHVIMMETLLADGQSFRAERLSALNIPSQVKRIEALLALAQHYKAEIQARWPVTDRNVAGYNLDALIEPKAEINLAKLLVGSEGTLALTQRLTLQLSPLLQHKVLGVAHFPTLNSAMQQVKYITSLKPTAIELVDHNMLRLCQEMPLFAALAKQFIRGTPQALLLVEFSESDQQQSLEKLEDLEDLMADHGWSWQDDQAGGVVRIVDLKQQAQIWNLRKQGLNIMMSMQGDDKPIAFIEDCAVNVEKLPEYTDALQRIFKVNNVSGVFYGHASVGTLHVRPVINLKRASGVKQMRAVAEAVSDVIVQLKGSYSGEHGDGIVRAEFHQKMLGASLVQGFEAVKVLFDPDTHLNPNRLVNTPPMDQINLLRYSPAYQVVQWSPKLDWAQGGMTSAVEMCNSNGACLSEQSGNMCPSYRVTQNERDSVRGRSTTLRLALSGQLGDDALSQDAMQETLLNCVGCKACKSECPMRIDMAKMKIEVQAARAEAKGLSWGEKSIAFLPEYGRYAAKVPWLFNLRNRSYWLRYLSEKILGYDRYVDWPKWHAQPFKTRSETTSHTQSNRSVLLFIDTFSRYFEPELIDDAIKVIEANGDQVRWMSDYEQEHYCCGRTHLTTGRIESAREKMTQCTKIFKKVIAEGGLIVGLEPSCLLGFRDEAVYLLEDWDAIQANKVMLIDEYLDVHMNVDQFKAKLTQNIPLAVYYHAHCHQRAANQEHHTLNVLQRLPQCKVSLIDSGCCGMAGSFGYQKATSNLGQQMGERSLLPTIRQLDDQAVVIASGTSCRSRIKLDGYKSPQHMVSLLAKQLS